MKKKILGGLLVVAIAAVAAFNVNMNTEKNELSLLALANVEALASAESNGGESRSCDAGGRGTSSCSITKSQIAGIGGGSMSVSCNSGYYACCTMDTWGNLGASCVKE